jgi:hypothetical protein
MDISYYVDFYNLTPELVEGCLMYEDGICYALVLSALKMRVSSSPMTIKALAYPENKICELSWFIWQDWHRIIFVDLNGQCFQVRGANREF